MNRSDITNLVGRLFPEAVSIEEEYTIFRGNPSGHTTAEFRVLFSGEQVYRTVVIDINIHMDDPNEPQ